MSLNPRDALARDAGNAVAVQKHYLTRLQSELDFARGLAGLHTSKAKGWGKLIDQAEGVLRKALDAGRLDRLEKVAAEAEELLAPVAKAAKTYTIHCVGHGHIDMNWMWSWPETVAVTNDTFITVLKLMEEFPDFCYSQSQASVYAICRDYNPELLEAVKARVAEGRWEVTAAHWVEGDKNIASGEALARHLLYTRRFTQETLGVGPDDQPLDWEPDTFGHAITIPSIDARGGVKRYYMCRGGTWEKPPVFWYRGPDGSRVLVLLDAFWYNGVLDPTMAGKMLSFCGKTGLRDFMFMYGMGDHGGGPTRRDILAAHDMDAWPVWPKVRLATTRRFYEVLEKTPDKWPVIDRELNFEFTGCYTSQSQIKRNNRYGENYMLEAELASVLAWRALGRAVPAEVLQRNWTDVLFSHFHDILPGSGFPETRQYNQGQFQRIAAATSMVKTHALRAIAAKVDTSFAAPGEAPMLPAEQESTALGAGVGRGAMVGGLTCASHTADGPRPFVVFNPTAFPRSEVVQATVWDADTGANPGDINAKSFVVRTPDGAVVPAQKVNSGNYWGHKFVDLLLPVTVGPYGYASVVVEEGQVADHAPAVRCIDDPPRHVGYGPHCPILENEHLLVAFDSLTGGIVRLVDKATGRDLADPANPMGVLEYVLERPGGMTAWIIAPTKERIAPLRLESFGSVSRGPHAASMVAKLKIKDSTATVTYTLKAGQRWLDIDVSVRWVERGGAEAGIPSLKIAFPSAVEDARARYEVPFGSIERHLHDGEEVPALRWADVAGKQGEAFAGLAVANDSKYGHSLDGSTLRVTLIRSSYDPDPLPEIGDHAMRFAVAPHGEPTAVADLVALGAAVNHPLQVVATDVHEGRLPAAAAGVAVVEPADVVITSVRKAQDEEAVIFHLLETAGQDATARVKVDRVLLGAPVEAVEVDFLERPVPGGSAKATDDGFTASVPGFGIACVKVVFE